jgi:uncharacterized protein with FMN-binding domain
MCIKALVGDGSHITGLMRRIPALVIAAAALSLSIFGCGTISALNSDLYLANVPVHDVDISTLQDGSYSGEYTLALAPGQYAMNRHFLVKATIASGRYAGIAIVEPTTLSNDPGFIGLMGRITSSDSLLVDTVSGATFSTRAMLKAVEAAVAQ